MFYQGKIYTIKKASMALQIAVRDYIRDQLPVGLDCFEQYEAIEEQKKSLRMAAFMVKHLIPEFPAECVTMESKEFLLRMIHLKHADPDREAAIEQRDHRNWQEEQSEVPTGVHSGSAGEVRPESVPEFEEAVEIRPENV